VPHLALTVRVAGPARRELRTASATPTGWPVKWGAHISLVGFCPPCEAQDWCPEPVPPPVPVHPGSTHRITGDARRGHRPWTSMGGAPCLTSGPSPPRLPSTLHSDCTDCRSLRGRSPRVERGAGGVRDRRSRGAKLAGSGSAASCGRRDLLPVLLSQSCHPTSGRYPQEPGGSRASATADLVRSRRWSESWPDCCA